MTSEEPLKLLTYNPSNPKESTDWESIKQAYIGSKQTAPEIAKIFGLSASAVEKKCAKEGWTEERKKLALEHEHRALNRHHINYSRLSAIKNFCEADLKVAKEIRDKISKALSKDEDLDPKDLRALASAHESAQRVGRIALGLPSTIGQNSTTIEGGDSSKPITVDVNTFADLEITELLVLKNTLQKIGVGLDDS